MTALHINELARTAHSEGVRCEYTRRFEVQWSDGTASESAIASAVGIGYFNSHPDNFFAFVSKIQVDQDQSNPATWYETITYKMNFTEEEKKEREEPNPLDRPPVVSFGWESMRMPVREDRDGNVIKNAAGQVPEQVPEVDGFLTTFNIKANVFPVPEWVWTYRHRYGCINSEDFIITNEAGQEFPVTKGGAKIHSVYCSELKYENMYRFYEVQFAITLRDPPESDTEQEGWVFDMVNSGTKCLNNNKELIDCTDANGMPASSPMLLAANGKQMPVTGDPPDPVILYKNIYPLKDFTVLPACS